jgi:cell volume regulation protein A
VSLTIEMILLVTAILLLLSIVASKASGRLGVPALVLFLLVGMLAGSEGPGGIPFDNPWLAQSLGVVALVFILFSGGMDTDWADIRPVLWPSLALATIGVSLTAALLGWFATLALGFSWLEGLLLGAIVSSTDAAAVFTILRSRGAGLRGRLAPLIEFESGSNDPMAVFLTAALTGLLASSGASVTALLPSFALQMALGAALGYVMGRAITWVINHVRLEFEGLYPALTLALMLLTYALTAGVGGNGFLAVYVAGLVLGNRTFVHKKSLLRFHDGMAWLMQIAMFLALGLLVFPSRLAPIAVPGLLIALFLIFVARPIAVFVTLLPVRMSVREKAMVAWVGLRGAVPIILATFPLLAGLPNADEIFNLVFFIVLTSVLVQGTSIPLVARWLGVAAPKQTTYHYPLEFVPAVDATSRLEELAIADDSPAIGRAIVELGLPDGALLVLIKRAGENIVPNGGMVIQPGDRILALGDSASLDQIRAIMSSQPIAAPPPSAIALEKRPSDYTD